jgi:hypothetical protein
VAKNDTFQEVNCVGDKTRQNINGYFEELALKFNPSEENE